MEKKKVTLFQRITSLMYLLVFVFLIFAVTAIVLVGVVPILSTAIYDVNGLSNLLYDSSTTVGELPMMSILLMLITWFLPSLCIVILFSALLLRMYRVMWKKMKVWLMLLFTLPKKAEAKPSDS